MPQSFNKDKLIKDYYRCIQIQRLKKNNGDPYLKMRLSNKSGIIDAYLWDMINFYNIKIDKEDIYAVKAKKEVYDNRKVLNIKCINRVKNDRYDRYNYNSKDIEISKKKLAEYYYDELMESISAYSDSVIKVLAQFYIEKKKEILKSDLLRHKEVSIRHVSMLDENYHKRIDLNLCIIIILIDRLQINSLMNKIKKVDIRYHNIIELYRTNHKEFIKKYKYIVDLISYNFNNEKIFNN